MSFFFSNNPIALFAALVLLVAVLSIVLKRMSWFAGDKAVYITPVLIGVIVLCLFHRPLLSIISIGIPLLVILVVGIFAIAALVFAFGMPEASIWPIMKELGPLKVTIKIAIICIILFAISQAYGETMLKEPPSFTISEPIAAQDQSVEVDFAPLFTKQALGLIVVMVVLGLAFVFINLSG